MRNRIVLCWITCAVFVILTSAAGDADRQPPDVTQVVGSTAFQVWYPDRENAATLHFDHDILLQGNFLLAGEYALELLEQNVEAICVALTDVLREETFQFVVRTEESDDAEAIRISFVDVVHGGEPRVINDQNPPEPSSAELMIQWASREASVHLVMKGFRRSSSPAPDIPSSVAEPWSVVKASLDALVDEDIERHIENFSDDCTSGLVFGDDVEKHALWLHQSKIRGVLEGALLALDGLEWQEHHDKVVFEGIVVYVDLYVMPFTYEMERRGNKWMVTRLGVE